jgi:hypothetical protein
MNNFLIPIDVDALHALLHDRALAIAADQEWASEHTKVTGQYLALRDLLHAMLDHREEFGMTDTELVAALHERYVAAKLFRDRVEEALLVDGDGLTDDEIIDYITRELTTPTPAPTVVPLTGEQVTAMTANQQYLGLDGEPVKVRAVFAVGGHFCGPWEAGNLVEHCDSDADGAFVAVLTRYAEPQPDNRGKGWWEAVVTEILRAPADTVGPQVGEDVKLQEGYDRNRVIGHYSDPAVTETMAAVDGGPLVVEPRRFHPGDPCPDELMIVREADPAVDPILWARTGDDRWLWTDGSDQSVMSWDELLVASDGGVVENVDPDA